MSLIKNIYNPAFYNHLAGYFARYIPDFNAQLFLKAIYVPTFEEMEWKERVEHSTSVLRHVLPPEYKTAVSVILQITAAIQTDYPDEEKLAYVIFPNFIAVYGLDDFEASINAMEHITQFISCEFAVRPFMVKYPEQMLAQMTRWAQHPNYKVRRLASEGSRPRLPWAMALPLLKKDPTPVLPLLHLLMEDESAWVRKSVANHLNDISKDNPNVFLAFVKEWKGQSKDIDALIKHASRTLLKQAHPEVVALFALNQTAFSFSNFAIESPVVDWGNAVVFTFDVQNKSSNAVLLRLEYAMYYRKANGTLTKKVFKISERTVAAAEKINIRRRQSFKAITTRVYYPGEHRVAVIVNGVEQGAGVFVLGEAD